DLAQGGPVGDDLAAEGEVRPLDLVEQVGGRRPRVVDEQHAGVDDLAQVVRRDVGGQPDGDALAAVDEQVGELGGQDDRLLAAVVEVGPHADDALPQFRHQSFGDGGQLGLGVAVGGGL